MCLGFFCVVAMAMREHLFVWSVFAPKLLSECVYSVTLLSVHLAALLLACASDRLACPAPSALAPA